jgi:exopolyphosphatase / guanosine-5'-triphosphate,3'-diphosphate pyrophosphatase
VRVASIDIGTNSVLLLVAEQTADGAIVTLAERATITRLGEGVDRSGDLAAAAVSRTLACLRAYAGEARSLGVDELLVVGTSAMRDARGGAAFANQAEAVLGVRPRVISGEEEARLTFRGALAGLSLEGPLAVVDVGGGSTEVVVGRRSAGGAFELLAATSLDVGGVRLTERHVRSDPPSAGELAAVKADVDRALASLPALPSGTQLVGVAGTVTTLAAVARSVEQLDGALVHGVTLGAAEVEQVAEWLWSISLGERQRLPGLDPGRADVIVAGALVVSGVIRWAGARDIVVSDRGVRWGLVLERVGAGV